MVTTYPCDTPASSSCPAVSVSGQPQPVQQRAAQIAMVLLFAQNLGQQGTNGQDETSFASTWSTGNKQNLKTGLANVTNTGGIPSMIQYMSTYPIAGAPNAAVAVIAEANIFNSVASFEFTD
ncbi:hypothetical protein [Ralstonia solanacearum]|nr:hypothetical protein [Ralstonia solanacearum]